MGDKLYYPARVTNDEDGAFIVQFDDFRGECFTDGNTMAEAMKNARDALEVTIFNYIRMGKKIPNPYTTELQEEGKVVEIGVWLSPIFEEAKKKVVKKNCTIPSYLDELARQEGVNFSEALRFGVKHFLGMNDEDVTIPSYLLEDKGQ